MSKTYKFRHGRRGHEENDGELEDLHGRCSCCRSFDSWTFPNVEKKEKEEMGEASGYVPRMLRVGVHA